MTTCIKPTTQKDSPYSDKESKLSQKNSPYSQKDSVLNPKDSAFSELCLNYEIKVFQDDSPFIFQNGDQYIFN